MQSYPIMHQLWKCRFDFSRPIAVIGLSTDESGNPFCQYSDVVQVTALTLQDLDVVEFADEYPATRPLTAYRYIRVQEADYFTTVRIPAVYIAPANAEFFDETWGVRYTQGMCSLVISQHDQIIAAARVGMIFPNGRVIRQIG